MDTLQIYEILRYTINTIGASTYGNYFVLKGGSALMTMLIEENQLRYFRRTTDIDLHVQTIEVWQAFKSEIIPLLNSNNYGIIYEFIRDRNKSTVTSDSVILMAHTPVGDLQFGIDMNVKPYSIISVDCLKTINLKTYDKYTMLSDKIAVISSGLIFRRIKDIYDICVLSQLSEYMSDEILQALQRKNPLFFETGVNMMVPENMESIAHAYERFTGIEQKPSFESIIILCTTFLEPIYCRKKGLVWDGTVWNNIIH